MSGQLDALVGELDRSARTYEQRIRELDEMYAANGEEYTALGEAAEEGKQLLAALQQELSQTPEATDPMAAQAIADRRSPSADSARRSFSRPGAAGRS